MYFTVNYSIIKHAIGLLIVLFAMFIAQGAQAKITFKQQKQHRAVAAQIKANSEDTVLSPELLALQIIKAAEANGVSPKLFAAIIATESMYRSTINVRTQDYGLTQINIKTAKAYNWDIMRLLYDPEYALNAGAKLLAQYQKRYSKLEPNWFCRYNVGTGVLTGKRAERCEAYSNAVRKYLK